MTAKWTETTETTVPARVERSETDCELWTHKRSAHRCQRSPATPTEIGRGLQALEPAERGRVLDVAGVEPVPPATPEEIGEVLAGLEPDERGRALDAAGVPLATPDDLAAVVAALPPDEHRRVLRALGYGAAPERTPEALGAELAALDVCEFLRAARAAGIVEARRLPRASAPPLSVGGVPVMWSEITVTAVGGGGGGGGLPLSPLAVAERERDRLREELRERERDQLRAERGMDHWRERAQAAEQAEREATATADRARAARDRLEREVRNERNGAAGLRDALAAMKRERDGARDALAVTLSAADACAAVTAARLAGERDRARAERDRAQLEAAAVATRLEDTAGVLARVQVERAQEVAIGNQALAELAALREALNQPAHFVVAVEQPGPAACIVTDDTGEQAEVRRSAATKCAGLVRVNGGAWVWLSAVLLAARRAGALP